MARLPAAWEALLLDGVSYRVGACSADGWPQVCRALAARADAEGRLEVLLSSGTGHHVLPAIAASGHIALSATRPDSNRTLHVKGRDAEVSMATAAQLLQVDESRERFAHRVRHQGFTREQLMRIMYCSGLEALRCVRFTPCGAWDQTPGPGAGQALELLP